MYLFSYMMFSVTKRTFLSLINVIVQYSRLCQTLLISIHYGFPQRSTYAVGYRGRLLIAAHCTISFHGLLSNAIHHGYGHKQVKSRFIIHYSEYIFINSSLYMIT